MLAAADEAWFLPPTFLGLVLTEAVSAARLLFQDLHLLLDSHRTPRARVVLAVEETFSFPFLLVVVFLPRLPLFS